MHVILWRQQNYSVEILYKLSQPTFFHDLRYLCHEICEMFKPSKQTSEE